MFEVHLIRVAELADLTGAEVFELMTEARHIAGRYWMFEGDPESLGVLCEKVATGTTEAHGGMEGREFVAHAEDVFSYDFGDDPEGWEMVRAERWVASRRASITEPEINARPVWIEVLRRAAEVVPGDEHLKGDDARLAAHLGAFAAIIEAGGGP